MEQLTSFTPPHRILMGPGPSDVPQRILDASARSTIGHLDPKFIDLMDEIKLLLQFAFQTNNRLTMPISAPGSAGMEACFVNLVEPGEKVLVCINGVFGMRMVENVERCGGIAITVNDDWGKPVDPQKVEDALKADPEIGILAFVHAETSTGVRSDAATIAAIGKAHDCLVIADTVTAVGGIEVDLDKWRIDASYSGTQKCLSCLPGISPVSFSAEAEAKLTNRKQKVQSWFLDMNLIMAYWEGDAGRSYHHTAPINALYALHESLVMLQEEGLQAAWTRHWAMHEKLKNGLRELGIGFLVDPDYRLPQLNVVFIPDGVDDASVRNQLLEDYDIEIGAGLGGLAGKVWRIGLMGHSATEENVDACVGALTKIMG